MSAPLWVTVVSNGKVLLLKEGSCRAVCYINLKNSLVSLYTSSPWISSVRTYDISVWLIWLNLQFIYIISNTPRPRMHTYRYILQLLPQTFTLEWNFFFVVSKKSILIRQHARSISLQLLIAREAKLLISGTTVQHRWEWACVQWHPLLFEVYNCPFWHVLMYY